jgi:hypothetical protein
VGGKDERKRGGGPLKRRNERDNKGEKGKHGKSAGKPDIGSVRWYDSHRLVFLFYNPQKRDCLFSLSWVESGLQRGLGNEMKAKMVRYGRYDALLSLGS